MTYILEIPVDIDPADFTTEQLTGKFPVAAYGHTDRLALFSLIDRINADCVDTENNYLFFVEENR